MASTIPLSDTTPRNSYTASAGETVFEYSFYVDAQEDLLVYKNGTLLTIITDYTVAAVRCATGSDVVLTSGATNGDTIVIVRNTEIDRVSEFTTGSTINLAETLNLDIAKIYAILGDLKYDVNRTVKSSELSSSTTISDITLTGNAGEVVLVNATADGFETGTLVDNASLANFEKFSGDGDNSTTTFALGFTPAAVNALLVSVDDVVLEPTADFTISGTNITFSTAPSTGTDNIFVVNFAASVNANVPTDGSVTADKIVTDAVTTVKIEDSAVTTAKLATNAVTTAKITDANVTTVKIADDAVTLAKLADGTQGDILYYAASGVPTLLTAGTAGQVLQTNGAGANPSWVSTAIADNSVTLAKLSDGTQGGIIYYGASGEPTELAAGTSGQVLQTNGAGGNPSWEDQSVAVTQYTSSDTAINDDAITTFAHGLGQVPDDFALYIRCTSSDLGYSVGDIVKVGHGASSGNINEGVEVLATSTQIKIVMALSIAIINQSTLNVSTITESSWDFFVKAWVF